MVRMVCLAAALALTTAAAAAGDSSSSFRGADAALAVLRQANAGPMDALLKAIHAAEADIKEDEDTEGSRSGKGRMKDEETREIQHEVENMAHRVKFLRERDSKGGADLTRELDGIEEALEDSAQDKGLQGEIASVRADLCTQQGYQSHESASCEAFMRKACIPSTIVELAMPEVPQSFCLLFFKEEAAAEAAAGAAPAPGPAPGLSPAPMGVLFGGKGLRWMPEQGLAGDLVPPHEDWDTMITNWQKEYGPGHRDPEKVCKDHCPNQWCQIHGFCGKRLPKTVVVDDVVDGSGSSTPAIPIPPFPHHSAAAPQPGVLSASLAVALAAAIFALA